MKKTQNSKKPLLVAIGGMSGSGKTTLGIALAKVLHGAVLLDSDVVRKTMHATNPTSPLPDEAYHPDHIPRFVSFMHDTTRFHLKHYDVVIVTGIFLEPKFRRAQQNLARECGAEFQGLWLDVPLKKLFERVSARTDTPSDADTAVLNRQEQKKTRPGSCNPAWKIINASNNEDAVLERALEVLHDRFAGKKVAAKKPLGKFNNW